MGVKFSQLPAATDLASDDYVAVLDTSETVLKRSIIAHGSTANVYGLGSTVEYGHDQLVDNINATTLVNGQVLSARIGNQIATDIGTIETGETAQYPHAVGEFFIWGEQFVKVRAPIATGDDIVANSNVIYTTVAEELVAIQERIDNLEPVTVVEIPTVTVGTYYYTGSPQGPTITDLDTDHCEVTGATATNPGSYTLVISLIDPTTTVWSDGTTEDKEYSYAISSDWATAPDSSIVAMVNAADAGVLDLYTDCGWRVGDERQVSLSAMASTGVGESHVAQTVTFVLMHRGLYSLVDETPSGRTKCSFVVGMKNCLKERGVMNPTNTNSGSWKNSARRTWCNNTFRNAIPSSIRSIFKRVIVRTAEVYNGLVYIQTNDYFFLPSAGEVFKGDSTYGQGGTAGIQTAYSNLKEFNSSSMPRWTWYETTSNRVKTLGDGGTSDNWWERSPYYNSSASFCIVNLNGGADYNAASLTYGLAPAGCI